MYKLLLMAPDGTYVTEGEDLTLEEAGDLSANMGSRWIFYPFHFIIKDNSNVVEPYQRVIESNYDMPSLKGKAIITVQTLIRSFSTEE